MFIKTFCVSITVSLFLFVSVSYSWFLQPQINLNSYVPLSYYGMNYHQCIDDLSCYAQAGLPGGPCNDYYDWGVGNLVENVDLIPLFDAMLPDACVSEGAFYTITNLPTYQGPFGESFEWGNCQVYLDYNYQVATYTVPPAPAAPWNWDSHAEPFFDMNDGTLYIYEVGSNVPPDYIYPGFINVFDDLGVLLFTTYSPFNWIGQEMDLECKGYEIAWEDSINDPCYASNQGSYVYTPLDYKTDLNSLMQSTYFIDISSLILPTESILWFSVYSSDWNFIVNDLTTFTTQNYGAAPTFFVEFGGATETASGSVSAVLTDSCAVSILSASYNSSYSAFPVSVVPVITDGVYDFIDYNNNSGELSIELLDCNSQLVTQVIVGKVPTCSVTGSGGRVKDGRYRGASTKQRLIQKNVGGGYERQINN